MNFLFRAISPVAAYLPVRMARPGGCHSPVRTVSSGRASGFCFPITCPSAVQISALKLHLTKIPLCKKGDLVLLFELSYFLAAGAAAAGAAAFAAGAGAAASSCFN
jgi:hypothetical protein